jgi:ribosomal protein L29
MTQASQMETAQTLLSQSDELLAQNPSADNLVLHVDALKENLFALQSLDANVVKQNDSSKIAQQITQLENAIATLEQQLATAQAANTISTLAQRATQFIENAKNEQSDLVLYYLTSAESIIRQLVLVAPNMEMAKTQIVTLS